MQPDESNKSSSPLVIKSANNDSDWRLEEGDKPSRAVQVVKELHSRHTAFSCNVDMSLLLMCCMECCWLKLLHNSSDLCFLSCTAAVICSCSCVDSNAAMLMQISQADQAMARLHQAVWLPCICSSLSCGAVSAKKCTSRLSGTADLKLS